MEQNFKTPLRPGRVFVAISACIALIAVALWAVSFLVAYGADISSEISRYLQPRGIYWPSFVLAAVLFAVTATSVIVLWKGLDDGSELPRFWPAAALFGPICYVMVVGSLGNLEIDHFPRMAQWLYMTMAFMTLPMMLLIVVTLIGTVAFVGDHASRWSGL